ncbi:Hermansky-Pudlak syndrome 5 protein homolog isoform X2 [Diachasma alloeum]|uniref:Hermansky-Pudlak syndrome 5 protein homolog isoform X2 n=1 Tax=Diachasma alloeum TaxID=454923 RepID=UPI000738410F|nr:Hermansky-Pudlak syndrome 5 protein homolog isoform X2 [Diachasma alloeum]
MRKSIRCCINQLLPLSESNTPVSMSQQVTLSLVPRVGVCTYSPESHEGTVTHVQISPDEKTVALSTKRGSVCIITFKPLAKLLSISNEHLHETVTSLCWNSKSSEIYVGDNNGKISTIVLSIFTVNGMFQAPSCALMHLDSSIVQLDYSLHYLLVSTLTRCYICDTSQEQFRQIGNKARDGAFGACFMRKPPVEIEKNTSPVPEGEKSLNKSVGLNSIVGLTDDNHEENLLIYSARPGLRLWEVNLNGTVLKTHQFKDALAVPPSEIHRSALVRSIPTSISNEQNDQNILNFSHLFVISKRYLLSHSNTCLYIIDPTNAAVVLWTDKLDTIAMAQIIDDKIYLMNANGTFHCLMLSSIDYLIIKLFEMKLYNDCYNACMTFKSDLMKLVESNNPLMVKDFNDCSNGLVTVLEPVISVIQSNFSTQPKRLNCGIVVVNSGNSIASRNNGKYERNYDSSSDSEILCKSVIKQRRKLEIKHTDDKDINDLDGEFSRLNLRKNGVESSSKINGDEEESSDPRRKQIESATASIQSDIQPIYALISTLKSSITIEDLEDTIFNIVKTIQEINFKYEDIVELKIYLYEVVRSIERLYFHGLLESVSPEMLTPPGNSDNSYVVEEVLRAFVDLNGSDYSECRCGFPRYRAPSEPKFGDVGQLLMRKFSQEGGDNCVKLCKSVPYLWRDYLRIFIDKGEKVDHLHLCLQTRDNTVLSIILPLVGDDSWDIVAECDERMRIGRCIACGRGDEDQGEVTGVGIDWSGVALEILKRQGIHAAMTFLSDVGRKLPRIKLKESIFQSLICTKLLNRHGFDQVVEFDGSGEGGKEYSSICSKKAREVLADALEKDLNRPVNNNIFGSGAHHWGMTYKTRASVCPCCTLSLQTPVLLGNSGISIFPCGHAYHVNCLIQKKLTRCYLHSLE